MSFQYVLTLRARLEAEQVNGAIIFLKKYLFHYAVIFPTLLHSQSYNLGGSEKEDRDRKLLLETRKPHLKLWATGWLQNEAFDF